MPLAVATPLRRKSRFPLPMQERLVAVIAAQTEVMGSSLDVASTMRLVCEKAMRLTCADAAVVAMVEGAHVVFRAATGSAASQLGVRLPLEGSLSGRCVRTRELVDCEDTYANPHVHREMVQRIGAGSMLVCPLFHGNAVVGVLKVCAREPFAFGTDDVQTLQLVAPMLGAAVGRELAHHAQQALLREREAAARALEEKNAIVGMLVDVSPFMLGVAQVEGDDIRLLLASQAVASLLGCTREALEGRLLTELTKNRTLLDQCLPAFQQAARTGRPVHFRWQSEAEGQVRTFETRVGLLPQAPGERHRRCCYVSEDVTERSAHEAALREREEALRASLAEKDVLLKEVHHRVKNNLQVVVSLLGMQAGQSEPAAAALLRVSADRVRAMAMLHEQVYRARNLASVELGTYLEELTGTLVRTHAGAAPVRLTAACAPVSVGVDTAIPCGLVVNELVTNALKHAFPHGRGGAVHLGLAQEADGAVVLEVRDDGVGLPAAVPLGEVRSLGMQIVTTLAEQLDATLEVSTGPGATFRLRFPAR